MKKATLDKLEALHGAVADVLADGLDCLAPEMVKGEEGSSLEGYDARLVAQALTFLKDNDITVDHDDGSVVTDAQAKLEALRSKKRTNNDPFADIPHH